MNEALHLYYMHFLYLYYTTRGPLGQIKSKNFELLNFPNQLY